MMLLAMLGGLTVTPIPHLVGHWTSLAPVAGLIFLARLLAFISLAG